MIAREIAQAPVVNLEEYRRAKTEEVFRRVVERMSRPAESPAEDFHSQYNYE